MTLRITRIASNASDEESAKTLLSASALVAGAESEDGDADEIEHHGRDVHHVVGPVAPAGEEAVEVAEDFFGPEVDAAFAGIAMGEFDDGDSLRPEKKNERNDPEPDGDAAVGGDRWDDVEIEDGDDEKEDEVPTTEDAAEMWGV